MRVEPCDGSDEQVGLIAQRMRATLMEVLGAERGEAMYSLAWLVERVRFHLAEGAVFVALEDGMVGHTIVRREPEGFGLFSTTFVEPAVRRLGVADALLDAGEAWMRERGISRACTYTDRENVKLILLYEKRGYAIDLRDGEMVRLAREPV